MVFGSGPGGAGFTDTLASADGGLLKTAFKSPDYVPGVRGWAIFKNGNVEFNSGVFRGTVTAGVFEGADFIINSQGAFFYNGTPAKGTLIIALAASSGTDDFGNNYGEGANFGVWSAVTGNQLQHFGIDNNGNTYLANNADATVVFGKSADGALLFYNSAGQATGNLVVSIAPASGTDAGNSYQSGFQFHAANGANIELTAISGVPFEFFSTGATEETTAANIQSLIDTPGASEVLRLFVVGPQIITHTAYVYMTLSGPAKDGSLAPGGSLFYNDGTTSHQLYSWGPNGAQAYSLHAGDINTYQVQRLSAIQLNDITINQTTFSQQILDTWNLGVGRYIIEGQIYVTPNQAAGFIELEFGGSTFMNSMRVYFSEEANGQNAATVFGNSFDSTGLVTAFHGSAFGAADRIVKISGGFNVGTAGSFGLFAACGVAAGDTYIVRANGSYLNLYPVGP